MMERSDRAGGDGLWCQPMNCGKHTPRKFLLYFEDTDRGIAVFNDEAEARKAFEKANTAWNCYLFGALPRAAPPSGNAGEPKVYAYHYLRATATTSSGKPALWQNELSFGKPDTHEFIRDVTPLYAVPPQPAPDALREAIKACALGYRGVGGKMVLAHHVADDLDALAALSPSPSGDRLPLIDERLLCPPVPSGEPLAGDGAGRVGGTLK